MLKQWRVASILMVVVALGVFISACGGTTANGPTTGGGSTPSGTSQASLGTPGKYTCVQGSITASGSTALAPLVKQIATVYQGKCQGANITTNLGGSKTGLSQAASGAVNIGNSDVFASSSQSDLVDHQVTVVPFVLAINSSVTGVPNLTTDQIKGIYSGKTTNWKELGGADQKITVISRPASSGTRATFQQYILGGPETISGPSNLTSDSTGVVAQNIKQNAGAIGYITLHQAKVDSIKTVSIDGHAPTLDQIKNNSYKFWNIEHMYTKGQASGLTQAFLDYMTSSDARAEAQKLDFIAISDMSQDAIQAHQPKS